MVKEDIRAYLIQSLNRLFARECPGSGDIKAMLKDRVRLLISSASAQGFIESIVELLEYARLLYRLKQKEAELSELQSKFHPHCLYNTLEMIRSRCYQNGDNETAELIYQLAGIFRGFVSSKTLIPLQEERSRPPSPRTV
ncbi:MAG: histidine kinase [Lachnospiraceae bacterium]|jgi:two-component system sensor histidine kinase YesM|nr:histidine kinase [Lachnospiraceae bacterium]